MTMLRSLMLASVAVGALAVAGSAAAQTASPAATQGSDLSKSGLVGTLEGPQLILDPALVPKEFHEAPALAELVKAGKLPPVKDRLPAEPMVIKPLHEIGKYGGTWRRGFIGPGDVENGNRISATDKLLFWDESGDKIVPAVAKSVDMSEDGKTFTVHLRKGMKWSDGAPFTADDFTFWYQDIYGNKDVVPIVNLLLELQDRLGLSYLFIAHDLSVVKHVSDRVAVMYVGKMVEMAATGDLYARPRHPYTEALLSAVPKADPRLRSQRILLQGEVADAAHPPSGCYFHPRCRYAVERCRGETPELAEVAPGHWASCHRAAELVLKGVE